MKPTFYKCHLSFASIKFNVHVVNLKINLIFVQFQNWLHFGNLKTAPSLLWASKMTLISQTSKLTLFKNRRSQCSSLFCTFWNWPTHFVNLKFLPLFSWTFNLSLYIADSNMNFFTSPIFKLRLSFWIFQNWTFHYMQISKYNFIFCKF